MSLNRKFGACLTIFILLISSFSFLAMVSPNVKAEESEGAVPPTTLYFTSYYNMTDFGYSYYPEMSSNSPGEKNDSLFPPSTKNSDEWLVWFGTWLAARGMSLEEEGMTESEINDLLTEYREMLENLSEEELAEYGIFSPEDIDRSVEEYRESLTGEGLEDLFNPFIMQEAYIYTGEEEHHANGTVTFDLYFSSNLPTRLLYNDEVKVTVSLIGADSITFEATEIKNTTVTIKPKLFAGKIQQQIISIEDVDFYLRTGDQIVFSIEMIPSEKPIGGFIEKQDEERILELADMIADIMINRSSSEDLKEVGNTIKEFVNETRDGNITVTIEDLAELVNAVRSSSLIYNSIDHPSSVTIPLKLPGEEKTSETYYLSAGNVLTTDAPTNEKSSRAKVKDSPIWTGETGFSRNKILTGATASLYIQHRNLIRLLNLGKTDVTLTLSAGNQTIDTASVQLKKTTIFSILRPVKPTDFEFVFDPIEIPYDEDVSLKITSSSRFGLLGFRMAKVLYDSSKYPSSVTLNFKDTQNINMSVVDSDSEQKIAAMGSAEYILNITSQYADTVELNVSITDETGEWELYYPASVSVSPGNKLVHVFANHTGEIYGDYIQMTIVAAGRTGIASQELSATVSMDAVDYKVHVEVPSGKEIKHGTSDTYTFKIRNSNTGLISDSYVIAATSEHGWDVKTVYEDMEIQPGDEFNVDVTVSVPEFTDISSDVLTLTITSRETIKENKDTIVNVTTTVILPNILEQFYNFFGSSAESIGLDSVLGEYAGAFLIFIIVFIVVIFLVVIIYLLRRKYVELICLDRIKEIDSDGKAEFDISIHNPSNDKMTYRINVEMDPTSEGWEASVDTQEVILEPKQYHPVKLTVKPNDYVKTDGWVEVKVVAENIERQKVAKISTVTSVKNAAPELRISGVFHWPTTFKNGEKVVTSFRIHNDGKASASNVTIALFVNGEEKNKAENITIPRGGYAEIEMPWIAVKGKNEVNIVVK